MNRQFDKLWVLRLQWCKGSDRWSSKTRLVHSIIHRTCADTLIRVRTWVQTSTSLQKQVPGLWKIFKIIPKKKRKLWLLLVKKKLPNNTHASFSFFLSFFLNFLVPSHHSANELKNMCSVKTECWLQKFWKSLRLDSMAKNVLRVDRLFWKHMHFLTSGSLVFLMGFGSLCLSPDTTLRTALTSTGTPLDDWSWHLAFLVGKGGFRYAPKRLPVWHRLRLEGLALVGQNHLCWFSRVFQSSSLRLTLAN